MLKGPTHFKSYLRGAFRSSRGCIPSLSLPLTRSATSTAIPSTNSKNGKVPSTARTVIIGGGAVGSSIAYHLSKLGRTDIVLLEQGTISCGTTWHAAGLVGQLRNTASEIYLSCYGSKLYSELEAETGQATGFKRCGSLTLAQSEDRMIALKRNVARAKAFNIEAHMISPTEANDMLGGILETKDLHGALWLPGDGTISPSDLTASYIAGAKQRGVKVFEGVKVNNVTINEQTNQVSHIHTDHGDTIACDEVVIACGQWSRNVGKLMGVNIPLHSAQHFYIITESLKPNPASVNMPLFRDPDSFTYFREWSQGLSVGGFEPVCIPCFNVNNQLNQIPDKFEFQLFDENWDHFNVLMEGALKRIPSLAEIGVRNMINGPESFTPDNQYILGEAPERRKVYVAAGFNSSGIASSGGAGKALAEWIVGNEPPLDLWTVDIRRFSSVLQNNGKYLHDRTLETLGIHYQIPYPKRELESARPLRRSAIFDRLKEKDAIFGNKFGWERPNYFGKIPQSLLTNNSGAVNTTQPLTFGKPAWFDYVAREHKACREQVALFDQSSFAKLQVSGKDAKQFLQTVCSNDMDVPIGKIVYTGILNERGGMETDLTITRTNINEYLVITSTAQATRDMDLLNRNIDKLTTANNNNVFVTDITSSYSVFSLMGPNSRALLSSVSTDALDNDNFPFGTSKLIDIGYATVRANRITYVGELGWELYVPTEMAAYVYDLIIQANANEGDRFGLRDCGYYAIDSLRMEKGYRAWGAELSPDWTPYECGLGFAVKLNKQIDNFIGKKALEQMKKQPLQRKLCMFTIDDSSVFPWGSEPINCGGETVGYVTSAAYGFTINKGIVMAMVKLNPNDKSNKKYEIEVNGKVYALTEHNKPAYDPTSARVKM